MSIIFTFLQIRLAIIESNKKSAVSYILFSTFYFLNKKITFILINLVLFFKLNLLFSFYISSYDLNYTYIP